MTAFPVDPGDFFLQQLSKWHACAQRYSELRSARRRIITVEGRDYILIHNPSRISSATAKTDDEILRRPCFLCRDARPEEQEDIVVTPDDSSFTYHVAVNPCPILTHHFTIISSTHCRQTLTTARLADMAFFARQMKGFLLFFNGAKAGASAPDHFHFQAVRQKDVPLVNWNAGTLETLFVQTCEAEDVKVDPANSDLTNVLCWHNRSGLHWVVVSRHCHRPKQYYADGTEQILISPASLEYAGVVPIVREEDYGKMTPALLSDILRQCYDREPIVDVGICKDDLPVTCNSDNTFTLHGVRIGARFHWDQRKTLTYEGKLLKRTDKTGGGQWMVNRLAAEDYLRSVITSEMAATASLSLLKAHAVISRSWLVRQMGKKLHPSSAAATHDETGNAGGTKEIVSWYDASAHRLFDVCSDDHCQRYQGIPQGCNDMAARAVKETRGEVLVCGGRVIDARFSKCCGGLTEEYRYCWENVEMPCLKSVPDTRADGSVFCNTADAAILRQILNSYDLATSDFYEWEVKYTQDELSGIVERKQGLGLGKITALEPLERGRSGRISRLKITGENGSAVIGKELEIRRTLSETHLYSSAFRVLTEKDLSGDMIFTLKGRGWGHGVGLCQIGAAVMGAEGYDYKEILSHYYTGAAIIRIW